MSLEARFIVALPLLAVVGLLTDELRWRFYVIRRTRALFRRWDRMIDDSYFPVRPDPTE